MLTNYIMTGIMTTVNDNHSSYEKKAKEIRVTEDASFRKSKLEDAEWHLGHIRRCHKDLQAYRQIGLSIDESYVNYVGKVVGELEESLGELKKAEQDGRKQRS